MKRGVRTKLSRYSSVDVEQLVRFEALYRKAVLSSADAKQQYPELLKTYKGLLESASPAAQKVAYAHVQEVYELARSARPKLTPALWIFVVLVVISSFTLFLQPSITGLFSSDVVPEPVRSNHAPQWAGLSDVLDVTETGRVVLNGLFRDEDGDELTYLVQPGEGVLATVDGGEAQLAFEPGVMEGLLTVIASDGEALSQHALTVRKPGITPIPEIAQPVTEPQVSEPAQEPVRLVVPPTTEVSAELPAVPQTEGLPFTTENVIKFRSHNGTVIPAVVVSAPVQGSFGVASDVVDADVVLNDPLVKTVRVTSLQMSTATESVLDIDDVAEQVVPRVEGLPDWSEVYAVNPVATFERAELTITAKANRLFKCAGWNFERQSCKGGWQFVKELTPGSAYTIEISATDPGFAEINVTAAVHLDDAYEFVSNIFDAVMLEDDVWSEAIPEGHYVRATFEQELTNGNVINVRARSAGGYFVVFEKGTSYEVGRAEPMDGVSRPDIVLTGVTERSDTFDFKVFDAPMEFDYIHDNPGSTGFFMYSNATTGGTTFIGRPVYQNWTGSNMEGNESSAEGSIPDLGTNITNMVSRCSRSRPECYFVVQLYDNSTHLLIWRNQTRNWTNYTLTNWSGQEANNKTQDFDIECEDQSGDCLVVYENTHEADDKFGYRTITGATVGVVSSEQVATVRTEIPPTKSYLTVNTSFEYLKLYPQYGTDNIGVGWQTNRTNPDIGGGMWDGGAFHNFTNFTALGSLAPIKYNRLFDCAWEGLSQEFDCFWGSTQNGLNLSDWNPNTTIWTSRGWAHNDATNIINDVTACGTTTRTRGQKPKTDLIGLMTCDTANDLNGTIWNGSREVNVAAQRLLEDTASECGTTKVRGTQSLACALEASGNQFVFVWPDANSLIPEYGTFTVSTGAWSQTNWATGTSSVATMFSGLDDVDYLELTPNPVTDEMMLIGTNIVRGANCSRWTGSTFDKTGCDTQKRMVTYGNTQSASFDWYRYESVRCPMNLNESRVLDANTTGVRSCVNITGDNMTLNCNGNTIWFDSWGYGNTSGILARDRVNITIANCNIVDASVDGSETVGIIFANVSNGTIINSTIVGNGTTNITGIIIQNNSVTSIVRNTTVRVLTNGAAIGVRIQNASNKINVTDSYVFVNGTSLGVYALSLESLTANGTILNNNFSATGSAGFGIRMSQTNNTNFSTNVISNTTTWIIADESGNFANFSNTTFENEFGSMRFTPQLGFNGTRVVTTEFLNLSANMSRLNGTNMSWLNSSAFVKLTGLTQGGASPVLDGEDDGTYVSCPASKCTKQSYVAGVLTFNVSSWTTYSGTESSACGTITANTVLTEDQSAASSCITFGADNIYLDCAGFKITYDTSADGNTAGIIANDRTNINVTNCVIQDGTVPASSTRGVNAPGINFSNVNSSNIVNTTVITNGSVLGVGINILNGTNNTILNSSVYAQGDGALPLYPSSGYGIRLITSTYSRIWNNSIETNGTNYSIAVYLDRSRNISVDSNFIVSTGKYERNYGVYLNTSASNNNVTNNNIRTSNQLATAVGFATLNAGIRADSGSNDSKIINNTIFANGTGGNQDGILLATGVMRTNITGNFISVNGTVLSIGIRLLGGNESSLAYNTIWTNGSQAITAAAATQNHGMLITSSSGNNKIIGNNITTNGNNSNYGIYLESGNFNSVDQNLIRTNGRGVGNRTDNVGVIMLSNWNNISRNVIYTNSSGGRNFGIWISTPAVNNSAINNSIMTNGQNQPVAGGGFGGSTNIGIYLNTVDDNNIQHNTVFTNGTRDNYGLYAFSVNRSEYGNNTIFTNGSDGYNFGIFSWGSNYTIIQNNTFSTTGTHDNDCILLQQPQHNNTVDYNQGNCTQSGNGFNTIAGMTFISALANNASFNNFQIRTDTGYGVYVTGKWNTLANNTVNVTSTSSTNNVLYIGPNGNFNKLLQNNGSLQGCTNVCYGIAVWSATAGQPAENNTIEENLIQSVGSSQTNSYALYFDTAARNNLTNNRFYNVEGQNWIKSTAASDSSNITNTTFGNANASIRFPQRFNITGTLTLTATDLSLRTNETRIATTQRPFVNKSAFISMNISSLIAAGAINTRPARDEGASGTWNTCSASGCTEISETTDQLFFNVSQLSVAYAAQDNPDYCTTITTNVALTAPQTATGTCVTFGTDNITLDCQGNTITFDTAGAGAAYGVFADGRVNVTVKNCYIQDGNNLGEGNVGVNFTRTNNSWVFNNTIFVNGTLETDGIAAIGNLFLNVTNNTITVAGGPAAGIRLEGTNYSNITRNTVRTNSSGTKAAKGVEVVDSNFIIVQDNRLNEFSNLGRGVVISRGSYNLVQRNNATVSPGTGVSSPQGNYPYYVDSARSNTIQHNIGFANGSVDANYGLALSAAYNTNVTNNTLRTIGSDNNHGIDIYQGANNSIVNNTIFTNGSSSDNYGIVLRTVDISPSNVSQNNISYNYIQTSGTVTNFGIYLTVSALNNTVAHNRIFANGTGGFNYGIYLDQGSGFNNITNNTVLTNGTVSNHGVVIATASSNNSFEFNNITTLADNSYAISISSDALEFRNNTLSRPNAWVTMGASTFANFTNTRFETPNGSIVFPQKLAVNGSLNLSYAQLNITLNRTMVNVTNVSAFNSSADILLAGLALLDPSPAVDYDDDGTYVSCPVDVCTMKTYAGGIFTFNVSHWTAFAAYEGPITTCKTITSSGSFVVGADILATATPSCINISASDVVLDCQGYRITGSRAANSHGINSSLFNNITIKNCFIANFSDGIFLARNKNATVFNNTLLNNSDDGIELSRTNYSVVSHNNATDNGDNGIVLTSAWANNITNNTAQHSIGSGASSHGIQALSDAQENLFINNTLLDNLNDGLSIYESSNNTLLDNWAIRNGDDGYAITNGSYNVINHSFSINSTGTGLTLSFTNYSSVSFVNVTVSGTTTLLLFNTSNTNITNSSFGPAKRDVIRIAATSLNTLFNNITLVGNGSNWVNLTTENILVTNFTNTLFINESTSVRFGLNFSVAPGAVITASKLNLSLNRVLMNASNLTWLNTSANITLDGVSFTDPQAIVDYTDFDAYSACPADTCTEISYAGTTFRFNVSHWTSYSSRETPTIEYNFTNLSITKFDAWDPVNITGLVNYSITLNFTNGSFYGVNVSDLYPANTRFNTSTPAPATDTNDTFNLGDFSPGMVYTINITLNVLEMPNYTIMNNTVNVSWSNESLMRMNQSNMTNTTALVIPSTCGELRYSKVLNADVNSTGNCFSIVTSNISLDCNGKTIFWAGDGAAINATSVTNITVQNCFIYDNSSSFGDGSTSNTVGINFTNVTNGLIQNNSILLNDTSNGIGISVEGIENGDGLHHVIVNNSINATGSAGSHRGLRLALSTPTDADINLTNNTIWSSGTTTNIGVSLENVSQLLMFGNNVLTIGSTGIMAVTNVRSSMLKYNQINVSIQGAGGPAGGLLNFSNGGQGTNVSFNNLTHSGGSGQAALLTNAQDLLNISDNRFPGLHTSIALLGIAANYTIDRNNVTGTGVTFITTSTGNTNVTATNNFLKSGNNLFSSTVSTINTTFQNQTIENVSGKVTFLPRINITGARTFTTVHYNVSQNRSMVRAQTVEFMNVSAAIVFNALSYTNAMAVFDPGESGLYSRCPEHICTNTSYDGSVFKFNVSHWSTFAAQEYAPPNTQCEVLRNNSRLENDVNTSGTCFILAESNIMLDCNNKRILFDQDGGGAAAGVWAKDVVNVTVQNCIIQDMNSGGAFGVGINFTNVTQGVIKKNVIWTNGTTNNYGIIIQNSPLANLVVNNSIITQGSGTANEGIRLSTTGFVNITDNTISTNGTTANVGVSFPSSNYNTSVYNNTIFTNGTSTSDGLDIASVNSQINITNNTIVVSGTGSGIDLPASTALTNITILNNLIDTQSSGATNKGIVSVTSAASIFIYNNTMLTRSNAIEICSGCIVWTMDGNRINVTGGASIAGVSQSGSTQGYNISNNIINVFGTSSARGLSMGVVSGAYNLTNNRIYVNGTTTVAGVVITGAAQTEVINNTIIQNSTSTSANLGLSFSGSNARIWKNAIWGAGGAGGATLRAEGSNASIDNITLVAEGPGFSALNSRSGAVNMNISNVTITASNDWLNVTGGANMSFTNITFVTGNGSINYPDSFLSNNTYVLNKTHFDIRKNRAFENGTNNSAWNRSAYITLDLTDLSFTDPGPGVDYEDDVSYVTCTADVCTENSFTGNLFKLNVSHWTSFAAIEASAITITRPVNIVPPNDTTTTDRIINFNWSNSTTSDGNPVSYQLVIATSSTFSPASIIYNKTNIDPIAGNSTNQTINFSLDVDTTYWWRVVANSTTTFSDPSNASNFTVESLLSLVLLNVTVNFTDAALGTQNDTDDNLPYPFRLENNGNLPINISISSTRLFISGTTDYPTDKYRFKVRANEADSFNTSASNLSYINFTPSPLGINIRDLNWTNLSDDVLVDVNITVPMDEPAGTRNATVTFAVV